MTTFNNLIQKIFYESKYSKFLFMILLLALFSRGIPTLNKLYFLAPILLSLYSFVGLFFFRKDKYFRIFIILILLFSVWTLVTGFWSEYQWFTLRRGLYFLLVSFGSFAAGFSLSNNFKSNIINSFLYLNILFVLISLISLLTNTPENSWSGGNGFGFMGFTNHQNKLGQDIYITAAPLFFLLKTNRKNNFKYLIVILVVINIILLFFTVSRASILMLFFTWLFFLSASLPLKKNLFFSILFFIIGFGSIYMIKITHLKDSLSITKNETYFGINRETTLKYSFQAALNGGLFGLGYGISDNRFIDPKLGNFDNEKEGLIYRREKTVSLLALIEETGIVGLVLFLLIIVYPFKLFWLKILSKERKINASINFNQNVDFSLIIYALAFMITLNFYGQIESWWIGIGSSVLPIYFIYSGMVIKSLSLRLIE